jgi:phage baseplate assembly protein V
MTSLIRIVVSAVSDAAKALKAFSGSGRANETLLSRDFFQHYGFTSSPLPGASGIALASGNQVIMIAEDDPASRPQIQPGETALYNNLGSLVLLKADGSIVITAKNGTVLISGNLEVTGNVTATGQVHGSNI